MIVDDGKYYLYRHVRLDTNEVFYIGIGTKPKEFVSQKREYARAYTKGNRNTLWKRITNKTSYKVEILLESNDREFLEEKEIEFIALYGRKNLRLGTLSNLNDGGGKATGKVYTREEILRMCIPIHQYSLDGSFIKSFECMTDARKELGILVSDIVQASKNPNLKRSKHTAGGFQWRTKFFDSIEPYNKEKFFRYENKILQLSLEGEFIAEWKTVSIASRSLKLGRTSIMNCLKGWSISAHGYIWKYHKEKISENSTKRHLLRAQKKIEKLIKIEQYNLDQKLLNVFNSFSEATLSTKVSGNSIRHVLKGTHKSAGGFFWKIFKNTAHHSKPETDG